MGSQALMELLDTFFDLSLMRKGPATQDSTLRPPVRKSLGRGKADRCFDTLLGATYPTTEGMEYGSEKQGKTQAKGMCTLLRQRHRLLAPCQPLVRISQRPERPSGKDVANHPRVLPMLEH